MEKLVFFDSEEHTTLLPLTYTKPVSEIRVGILKIQEKWQKLLDLPFSHYTQPHLSKQFSLELAQDNLFIWGALLPSQELITAISFLKTEQVLTSKGRILAARGSDLHVLKNHSQSIELSTSFDFISRPWHIFLLNGLEIENDIKTLKLSAANHSKSIAYGDSSKLFIHPTARVNALSLNTEAGSIYVGPNAKISEGSMIRGPFALCENSTVKMGTKIYENTTVGPQSKVGGELNNVVVQGYSNKGHDGFLGNSVIGEWCNLGADTNCSNLKNNYSNVRVWDYLSNSGIDTELTFCGLIMGDHSKTGINTMLNTGTLVGVGSNIFGANFPPKFVPSFSWGSGSDFEEHNFEKFCSTASRVMARREIQFSTTQKELLNAVFLETKKFRQ